ncbi:hypothetical protein BU26DRAFT_522254 [Trematosphaeria pertusa]|uniref:Uncharacterized protein n=1 Tax=Trematosphaeria pertusa TaxID=390896 RepID=A0A6A6I4I7_9PLEO|nr:uncharacterized protein BU26DRAFT_522254 [Trematosphaeria pertusa]KAF2245139.1 hypothetical protein BU26DRAFT_522254 [Trematosphaeria pertusa]
MDRIAQLSAVDSARCGRQSACTEHDIIGLISREFRDGRRYKGSANAVATTSVVLFGRTRARYAAAAALPSFTSCIEWETIPWSILPGVQLEERMGDAVNTLCAYSFLSGREDEDLAPRIWISQRGDVTYATEKAVCHMADVFPSDDYANRAVWRAYLQHVLRLLENKRGSDDEKRSQLCLLVERRLRVDGRIWEAVRCLDECCRWRSGLDEEDSDQLLSQHALAIAYKAEG